MTNPKKVNRYSVSKYMIFYTHYKTIKTVKVGKGALMIRKVWAKGINHKENPTAFYYFIYRQKQRYDNTGVVTTETAPYTDGKHYYPSQYDIVKKDFHAILLRLGAESL